MQDEFDAPADWSRWGPGLFQSRLSTVTAVALCYSGVLAVPDAGQRYAFIIVTLVVVLLAGIRYIERLDAKQRGDDPHPQTRKILKHLPCKPYMDSHEELPASEREALDKKWHELVSDLM